MFTFTAVAVFVFSLGMTGHFIGEDYVMHISPDTGIARIRWNDGHQASVLFSQEVQTTQGVVVIIGKTLSSSDRNKTTPGDVVGFAYMHTGAHLLSVMSPDIQERWHNTACWQGANLTPVQRMIPDGFGSCRLVRVSPVLP